VRYIKNKNYGIPFSAVWTIKKISNWNPETFEIEVAFTTIISISFNGLKEALA